ncbi:type IV secretory system conjugative DNA transfer family protein [Gymnodinialimonas sp. 2305UL16-5]|uniref:type IV secretory system conjugative DNA transfer family protein n=1 Tax=Gymnodinialimonas mytili TaxID=3126503 RepID=UPI00309712FC
MRSNSSAACSPPRYNQSATHTYASPQRINATVPFEDMVDNTALRGTISRRARGLLNLMRSNVRQWGSLIQNARTETNFIDDLNMIDQLAGSDGGGRSFTITDLRKDPKGISVFLCLPDKPSHPAIRWQKALLTLMLDYMSEEQGLPETGKQVLMVLDEFASMGKMPMILDGMGSIAGAGVKLFVIITQIGDLMKHYGDKAWTKIPANCGTQLWFAVRDLETKKYIQEDFGEAQVVLYQHSGSVSDTEGSSETKNEAIGETETENFSEGHSQGRTQSTSDSRTTGHSQSISISDTDTWNHTEGQGRSSTRGQSQGCSLSDSISRGENSGTSSNHQFSVGRNGLFDPRVRSTNEGRGRSSNRGRSTNRSHTKGQNGSISQSDTVSRNSSDSIGGSRGKTAQEGTSSSETRSTSSGTSSTLSKTYAHGRSRQRTDTIAKGTSLSRSVTRGVSQRIQKRPLISVAEIGRFLGKVKERDHPAYPGFALVRIDNEEPMLVRKCYYDQDPIFEGCFNPH